MFVRVGHADLLNNGKVKVRKGTQAVHEIEIQKSEDYLHSSECSLRSFMKSGQYVPADNVLKSHSLLFGSD